MKQPVIGAVDFGEAFRIFSFLIAELNFLERKQIQLRLT